MKEQTLKQGFMNGKMTTVYICSPYRGDVVKNMNYTQECCKKIFAMKKLPIAPHLYFPYFMNDNNKEVREFVFEINKVLIDMCTHFVVFGNEISEGMKIEIDYAKSIGKEVYHDGV